jgi:hypothetical protein
MPQGHFLWGGGLPSAGEVHSLRGIPQEDFLRGVEQLDVIEHIPPCFSRVL